MRFTDLFLDRARPSRILAVALEYFGHSDIVDHPRARRCSFWMYIARVVRGQVLSLKEKEFVEAARASGASPPRIIVRHILPNMHRPDHGERDARRRGRDHHRVDAVVPRLRRAAPADVVGQHALRRRGLRRHVDTRTCSYFPGLMILLTVLAVNFLGDGLRDAFDPQSEKH